MSFLFPGTSKQDSDYSFRSMDAFDAEQDAGDISFDADPYDSLSGSRTAPYEHRSGKERSERRMPFFDGISRGTKAGILIASGVLILSLIAGARILLPIYENGTAAEQKLAAEHAASSEELAARLSEIRQTLEELNHAGILTAQAAEVPSGDPSLLYQAFEVPASGLSEEEFKAVRKELDEAEATLDGFASDLTRFRSENAAGNSDVAPQLDHLIDELSVTKENLRVMQNKTSAQLESMQTEEGYSNDRLLSLMNELLSQRGEIRADISTLRTELDDLSEDLSYRNSGEYDALRLTLQQQSDSLNGLLQNSLQSSISRLESSLSGLQTQITDQISLRQSEMEGRLSASLPSSEFYSSVLSREFLPVTEQLDSMDTTLTESMELLLSIIEEQQELLQEQMKLIERNTDSVNGSSKVLAAEITTLSEKLNKLLPPEEGTEPEIPDPGPQEPGSGNENGEGGDNEDPDEVGGDGESSGADTLDPAVPEEAQVDQW